MQAIQTKYHGPTDSKGSRVSAEAPAGRIYVEYDDGMNSDANHLFAAMRLANKFHWLSNEDDTKTVRELVSGTLKDGSQVHVLRRIA